LKRRPELFVPPITLDRASKIPLHRQIRHQIAQAVSGGHIQYEARLPSTRVMARVLDVSRNTVLAAYEDLAVDGLVRENEAPECALTAVRRQGSGCGM
jgi:GntR family transcriptional regulator/MocR family aminotransferase